MTNRRQTMQTMNRFAAMAAHSYSILLALRGWHAIDFAVAIVCVCACAALESFDASSWLRAVTFAPSGPYLLLTAFTRRQFRLLCECSLIPFVAAKLLFFDSIVCGTTCVQPEIVLGATKLPILPEPLSLHRLEWRIRLIGTPFCGTFFDAIRCRELEYACFITNTGAMWCQWTCAIFVAPFVSAFVSSPETSMSNFAPVPHSFVWMSSDCSNYVAEILSTKYFTARNVNSLDARTYAFAARLSISMRNFNRRWIWRWRRSLFFMFLVFKLKWSVCGPATFHRLTGYACSTHAETNRPKVH